MSKTLTNFAALSAEQILIRSMRLWKEARIKSFTAKFEGTSSDAMIQRITELKESEKGTRALITLVHDLEGDGVAGDRFLEGNEEAMISSEQEIKVDMLRHAVRHKGRMADQKSIINFRNEGMNKLSYWLANRWDQMAFLHLSGVSYAYYNNGAPRINSQLSMLEFADDANKPLTSGRHYRWDATNGLRPADTTAIVAADTVNYEMLVNLKTAAQNAHLRPIRTTNGIEHYNVFLTPDGMKALKLDTDYRQAVQHAMPRSESNQLFKGTDVVYVDGLAIFPHHYVFNTKGAAAGSKWGGGTVDGQRVLLCGAQALAKADIGRPRWVEKEFDFDNQPAISTGKISGFMRPQFRGIDTKNLEEFSLIAVDTAI